MSKILKDETYNLVDLKKNSNKWWQVQIIEEDDGRFNFQVYNGRVGDKGQTQKPKYYNTLAEAEKYYDKKVKSKLRPTSTRPAYTLSSVLSGTNKNSSGESTTITTVAKHNLADIAAKQIGGSSEVTNLIRYLSKKNIHDITSATTMTYDSKDDVFRTPLGVVTQEGIDSARVILDEIAPYVKKRDYENHDFIDKFQQYVQIIPHVVSRKMSVEDVFPNIGALPKESQLLDALDASLQDVLSSPQDDVNTPKKKKEKKVFNVSMEVMDDKKTFNRIKKFFDKTKNSRHTSYNLRPKKIYTVKIDHMHNAFEKSSKNIGGIMELWHGTRTANLLSILKGGLIIPRSSDSHVTGRMFADGLYFSDQSTKSLNYSQGYWGGGGRDNNPFMFLCSVAMGRYYVPSGPSHNLPKPGYNSTFAKARKSGVMNNEMIVYSVDQCDLNYLIEFSK